MSYYLEARKHERSIRQLSKAAQKKADERKTETLLNQSDPNQSILVEGRSLKLIRNTGNIKYEDLLMKWQDRHDNLIDRFDARAHMDFIAADNESETWIKGQRKALCYSNILLNHFTEIGNGDELLMSVTEKHSIEHVSTAFQSLLNYERYRGIIKSVKSGKVSLENLEDSSSSISLSSQAKNFSKSQDAFLEDIEYTVKKRSMY